jgi:hypothetical protein
MQTTTITGMMITTVSALQLAFKYLRVALSASRHLLGLYDACTFVQNIIPVLLICLALARPSSA